MTDAPLPRTALIVVTHLLGVGHLTRAAALGRGLATAGWRVVLASGGRPAPLVPLTGVELVQLPPVHCVGTDFRTLLGEDGQPIPDAVRATRIRVLLDAYRRLNPSMLVTETFPFGRRALAPEFLAVLEAAEAARPRPAVLASVRDILNPPSRPERATEAEERLGRHYDGVLVHGDPALAALDTSWPVSPALRHRLVYTGYVAEGAGPAARTHMDAADEIVVSGGGSAASLPLLEAAIGAEARLSGQTPRRRWRVLVGHGVPAPAFEALAARAHPFLAVERARPDFPALLAGAALSVSQAGYNTVTDLLAAGTPSVLVPFEAGQEAEQRLRAGRLAAAGRAHVLREADLGPERLASVVDEALRGPPPTGPLPRLDGIAGSRAALAAALGTAGRQAAARNRLDAALDRVAASGRTLAVWWRDDDATEPGPALDRLLALARRHGLPLALAAIPAMATAALAAHLHAEPGATVLVHGLAHADHAPPGHKSQELGHRPIEALERDAAEGLARAGALFGSRLLPVLVPPWNRIDPALVPRLGGLGYRGLSVAGDRAAPLAAPGLAAVNTHLDPIDWRGTRSLADPAALLDRLAAALLARLGDSQPEPIGLLTHHKVHDAWVWTFLDRLLGRLAAAPGVRVVTAGAAFGLAEPNSARDTPRAG